MSTVNEIKNELVKMGLPTQTPGLIGEERLDELRSRLHSAQGKTRAALAMSINTNTSNFTASAKPSVGSYADSDAAAAAGSSSTSTNARAPPSNVADLTISEIRSRLNALGENTNTPGLNGEERRAELMKRLVVAICGAGAGDDDDDNDDEEEGEPRLKRGVGRIQTPDAAMSTAAVDSTKSRADISGKAAQAAVSTKGSGTAAPAPTATATPPPKYVVPPPPRAPPPARASAPTQPAPQAAAAAAAAAAALSAATAAADSDEGDDTEDAAAEAPPASQSEINELKKNITRMSNKRAMYVAARLSGTGQDQDLKDFEKSSSQADAELARITAQKQRSKLLGAEKASSLLVEGGASMPIARLQAELEQIRNVAKENIKGVRQRIRDEGDVHSEFGVAMQKRIEIDLADAVASKSRTRRKILDIKSRGSRNAAEPDAAAATTLTVPATATATATAAESGSRPASSSSSSSSSSKIGKGKGADGNPKAKSAATGPSKSSLTNAATKGRDKERDRDRDKDRDRFDARVDRMERESAQAMDGLDALLADMQFEEDIKAGHARGNGSGSGSGGAFASADYESEEEEEIIDMKRLRQQQQQAQQSQPQSKGGDVVHSAAALKLKERSGGAGAPAAAPAAATKTAAVVASGGGVVGTRALPPPSSKRPTSVGRDDDDDEQGQGEGEEEEEEEEEDVNVPTSESPLRLSLSADKRAGSSGSSGGSSSGGGSLSLSARRAAPPPTGPPPTSAKAVPAGDLWAAAAGGGGEPLLLRTGGHFDNDDDDVEEERGGREGEPNAKVPPSGSEGLRAAHRTSASADSGKDKGKGKGIEGPVPVPNVGVGAGGRLPSRPVTADSSAGGIGGIGGIGDEEEDDELLSLLRKYPQQRQAASPREGEDDDDDNDDDNDDDEEEEEEEEVEGNTVISQLRALQAKKTAGTGAGVGAGAGGGASGSSGGSAQPKKKLVPESSSSAAAAAAAPPSRGLTPAGAPPSANAANHLTASSSSYSYSSSSSSSSSSSVKKKVSPLSLLSVSATDTDELAAAMLVAKTAKGTSPRAIAAAAATAAATAGGIPSQGSPQSRPASRDKSSGGRGSPLLPVSLPVIPAVAPIARTSPIAKAAISRKDKKPHRSDDIEDDDDDDDDDDDGENIDSTNVDAREIHKQLSALRKHARILERLGDLAQTEKMYRRCLELDPLHIHSLMAYAQFLHKKRGEVGMAESYYVRAIQVCLPTFLKGKDRDRDRDAQSGAESAVSLLSPTKVRALGVKAPTAAPLGHAPRLPERAIPPAAATAAAAAASISADGGGSAGTGGNGMGLLRVLHVVRLLVKYAEFLRNGKGDISGAISAYRKAAELNPNDSTTLANLARFLADEGDAKSSAEALELFARAMRASPNHALHALWYARLLKKNNQIGQADLMYRVALANSVGQHKIEPAAICNYATFRYRQRKDLQQAQEMFTSGLEKFPGHKGLVRNYMAMLKMHPELGKAGDVAALRMHSPKRAQQQQHSSSGGKGEARGVTTPTGNGKGSKAGTAGDDDAKSQSGGGDSKDDGDGGALNTKRAVARVHARMLLTTSGAPVDASAIAGDAETPSKLKKDYNASLQRLERTVAPWTTEEEVAEIAFREEQQQRERERAEQRQAQELKEMDLAELSHKFNEVFNSTNNNSVVGDDNDEEDDDDDDDDDDDEEYRAYLAATSTRSRAGTPAGASSARGRDLDADAGIYDDEGDGDEEDDEL